MKSKILIFQDPDFDDVEEVISDFKKNSESFISDGEIDEKNSQESPNSDEEIEVKEKNHKIFEEKIKEIEEEKYDDELEMIRKRSNSLKNDREVSQQILMKNKSKKDNLMLEKKKIDV